MSATMSVEEFQLREPGVRQDSRPAPPNGGIQAWLKVFGCFLVFVNTYGVASTYGAYQAQYQSHELTAYSPSSISWIGTTQVFLLGVSGVVAGPIYDRGYAHTVLSVGGFLVVLGLFMLSISQTYLQILFSQGSCVGIGTLPNPIHAAPHTNTP